MTGRDRSLDYRCTTCGAAPREVCEMKSAGAGYESHPARIEAMHTRELFRKCAVIPTVTIGSSEKPLSAPQKIKQSRIAMMIYFG